MISDMIIHHVKFSAVYIMGSIFVAFGFIVVNINNPTIDRKLKQILYFWRENNNNNNI